MLNNQTLQGLYYFIKATEKKSTKYFDMLQGLKKQIGKEVFKNDNSNYYLIYAAAGETQIIKHNICTNKFTELINKYDTCIIIEPNNHIQVKKNNNIECYKNLKSKKDILKFLFSGLDAEENEFLFTEEKNNIIENIKNYYKTYPAAEALDIYNNLKKYEIGLQYNINLQNKEITFYDYINFNPYNIKIS